MSKRFVGRYFMMSNGKKVYLGQAVTLVGNDISHVRRLFMQNKHRPKNATGVDVK